MEALANIFTVVNETTGQVDIVRTGIGLVAFSICLCALLSAFYVIKSAVKSGRD